MRRRRSSAFRQNCKVNSTIRSRISRQRSDPTNTAAFYTSKAAQRHWISPAYVPWEEAILDPPCKIPKAADASTRTPSGLPDLNPAGTARARSTALPPLPSSWWAKPATAKLRLYNLEPYNSEEDKRRREFLLQTDAAAANPEADNRREVVEEAINCCDVLLL